jgi:hypothetical protein
MFTDITIQQIEVAHLESKRRDEALLNEQLRIARMDRPSLMTLIAQRLVTMLITIGERLYREPVTCNEASFERFNATRTS